MRAGTETNITRNITRRIGRITAQTGELDLRISEPENLATMRKPSGERGIAAVQACYWKKPARAKQPSSPRLKARPNYYQR
jgi:hypothetical protein